MPSKSNLKNNQVAIIGAGPAGMAVALQLQRYGIQPLVFEQNQKGSLLNNAFKVENLLGDMKGISGQELLKKLRAHLAHNKIRIIKQKVTYLNFLERTKRFLLKTASRTYYFTTVFVASGTKPNKCDLLEKIPDSLNPFWSYEILPFINCRRKQFLIIGAGDAAFDYALNLARNNKVILLNRSQKSRALAVLIKRALKNKNIRYYSNFKLIGLTRGVETNLKCEFANKRKKVYINTDYLIIAIGRESQKDFYSAHLSNLERSLIGQNRLFLVGDVNNEEFRQVAIAIGDGIKAAMALCRETKCLK